MNGANLLVAALENEGVKQIFGVPGEENLDIVEAALDIEGCLLIAHEGFGSVWRLSPHAEPLDRIVSCAARATMNLAFGGPGNARLFIVESQTGSILQADLSTPGLPMFSHS
jgi:gluconolactonase